jgi:hypothetical protein
MMELIKSKKDSLYLAYFPKWEDYNFQVKSEIFVFYEVMQKVYDFFSEKYPDMQTLGKKVSVRRKEKGEGEKGRRGEGEKGRRGEGEKGRRGEGEKGRREEGEKGRREKGGSKQ